LQYVVVMARIASSQYGATTPAGANAKTADSSG
jgi:hypothetical protein